MYRTSVHMHNHIQMQASVPEDISMNTFTVHKDFISLVLTAEESNDLILAHVFHL